jgi:hypothetical protein
VDLALAMSATEKCGVILLFTGVAAPIAGILFRRVGGSWDSIGQGPFAIDPDLPQRRPLELVSPVDPAIQAAEARQMLEAKAFRQRRRGEAPIDVEAEIDRALGSASPAPMLTDALRTEVRQLVGARNERLMRKGEPPLDVEAEIERQLANFVGSR